MIAVVAGIGMQYRHFLGIDVDKIFRAVPFDDANVTYLSRFDKNTNKFTFYPSIDYRTEGYIIVGMRCNIEDMKIDEKNIFFHH